MRATVCTIVKRRRLWRAGLAMPTR
jgi:hypothetical protein